MTTIAMRTSELWQLLRHPVDVEDWGGRAACFGHDPELWQPVSKHPTRDSEFAKSICRTCPIMGSCLRLAQKNGEHGIWGGLTKEERDTMKRGRRAVSRRTTAEEVEAA